MLNARPGSRILKLVREVQSDKLNISSQWLRGEKWLKICYIPVLSIIITVLSSELPSKESHCSQ